MCYQCIRISLFTIHFLTYAFIEAIICINGDIISTMYLLNLLVVICAHLLGSVVCILFHV